VLVDLLAGDAHAGIAVAAVDVQQAGDAALVAHHVQAVRVVAPVLGQLDAEQVADQQPALGTHVVGNLQGAAAQDAGAIAHPPRK
jgi:hypothetical protein